MEVGGYGKTKQNKKHISITEVHAETREFYDETPREFHGKLSQVGLTNC